MRTKYGFITTESRSSLMSKIKSKDSKSEIILRKELWKLGLRYRKNFDKLPGKPDIVFLKHKIAVFIDGEFWHGHNWSEKKDKIKGNKQYWVTKIEGNIERDKKNRVLLEDVGFIVLRFWEKQIKTNLEACIKTILEVLKDREFAK